MATVGIEEQVHKNQRKLYNDVISGASLKQELSFQASISHLCLYNQLKESRNVPRNEPNQERSDPTIKKRQWIRQLSIMSLDPECYMLQSGVTRIIRSPQTPGRLSDHAALL